MTIHKEATFENEICAHLAANGWLYAEGDAARYDRARALFPDDALAWIEASQPAQWESLVKTRGAKAGEILLDRLRAQIDQRGTLDVLRYGLELFGSRGRLKLAEFKPASAINEEILGRYRANRLRVVRQVRYSVSNGNSIDLVLFLNGVPVATVELKSDFTQSVEDAIDQYRHDRLPRPKGQPVEPLLSFPSGALVHFAVSNTEVYLTTRLAGTSTEFLPFNKGDNGGKGNPPDPAAGHRTGYLWREVLERESWLEILGRYVMVVRDEHNAIQKQLFPRYHQLDVTRRLQADVLANGAGARYLVQHSAGSGKTNSIAWTAHFFAELHDARSEKVFHSVIVVSDRNVIDGQLQAALGAFQRQQGVVASITSEDSSKSEALAEALSGDKKIVVCTIQTFPFAMKKVRELAATAGKRFAVIADEAHSSQSGEAASRLKAVLTAEELKDIEDGGSYSAEDMLAAQMATRAEGGTKAITFVAFTATPKQKTLELFGTLPDPSRPAGEGNLPKPFHVYSMRQAIEEGFILDVLRNYTTYNMAFKLAHNGAEYDERTVERAQAMKGIMGWVRLHPHNISQKVALIVEHYRAHVAPLLDGKAKAMVVVGSRIEAVRWKLAIEKYVAEKRYEIGTLVAFSGEVTDRESAPDSLTEHSPALNPGLSGKIEKAFQGDRYRLLLVANKFQTGFDQPLLCGMYVHKRLAGIQAVQTLSRLNRAHPGKDTTYILDFVNEPEEIRLAFRTYYETAELADVTDPNTVYNLRERLDSTGYYSNQEIDRVVGVAISTRSTQGELAKAIFPVGERLVKQYAAAKAAWNSERAAAGDGRESAEARRHKDVMESLALFKSDMGQFVRLYAFLSQIFDFGNTEIEARAIFFRLLIPLLEFDREREVMDLSKVKLTHYTLRRGNTQGVDPGNGPAPKLKPITSAGTGKPHEKIKARLGEIIERVNELFDGDLTEQDKLAYVNEVLVGKLLESQTLRRQAASNEPPRFLESPTLREEVREAVLTARVAHQRMSDQLLRDEPRLESLAQLLVNYLELHARLRELPVAS
jgi:type I restriction enzyme R subunit